MAGVLQGEKQLFEKFWKGTFKAVAMPRPESIIVASITARRAVTKLETAVSLVPKDDEEKAKTKDTVAEKHKKNGHMKRRGRKRHSHRRARRKETICRLSEGQGATLIADTGAGKQKLGVLPAWKTDMKTVKNLVSKMVAIHQLSTEATHAGTYVPFKEYSNCIMQVSPSRPGVEGLSKMVIVQDSISSKGKGHADYDSGNDTSSPPSSKTGITKSKVTGNGKFSCQDLTSPEKLRLGDGDNASDSGNSLTSYDSLVKKRAGTLIWRRHSLWVSSLIGIGVRLMIDIRIERGPAAEAYHPKADTQGAIPEADPCPQGGGGVNGAGGERFIASIRAFTESSRFCVAHTFTLKNVPSESAPPA
ncbi:serine arginine repetitive matrix 4 [Labeo rohita]|uniref:Serine arginine repetitive matrix 4 n=1 Tax=Labeo rohita TaxID=84645 RepID=A0A498NG44_LABRO|nr:serine arginine repetitive matrix 4 [Labeo rohita]